jgi:hypothetical protein
VLGTAGADHGGVQRRADERRGPARWFNLEPSLESPRSWPGPRGTFRYRGLSQGPVPRDAQSPPVIDVVRGRLYAVPRTT